jgi:hypothetical protein
MSGVGDVLPCGRLVAAAPPMADGGTGTPTLLSGGPLRCRLVVEGLPVESLGPGTRLRVGASAVIALEAPASEAGPTPEGGVLEAGHSDPVPARVVEGGAVAVGDPVAIEAVEVEPGDELDLHSFRPEEIADVVLSYLATARARGLTEVRIVHGRGRGVQRAAVRRLLATLPDVVGSGDALHDRGGWGATVVRLRGGGEVAPR